MKKILTILLLSTLFLAACSGNKNVFGPEADGKIKVVTTVGMISDVAKNVGGDYVYVKALMGPGVDPHLYKASAGDINRMDQADIIFYGGLHLEGKMVEFFESMSEKNTVIAVSKDLSANDLLAPQAGQTGSSDPHIWFDVELWSKTVDVIVQTLSEKDPEHADVYSKNAEVYKAKLSTLDAWVIEQIKLIPEDQRIMITAHDAFNYFGRAYGMDVRGVQGISTAADYGLKDIELLINLIVEKKIKAVFVESSVSPKSIEALKEGVNDRGWNLKIGGNLFSDAMGDSDTFEGTYIGMVTSNVNTIVNALK